jgi:hypothetical protein
MHPSNPALVALASLLLTSACLAQTAVPAPVSSNKQVLEDDNVRIEESRTRGEVQNITVQSKLPGVKSYNIVPLAARKDPSQEAGVAGLAGKRTWSLLDF